MKAEWCPQHGYPLPCAKCGLGEYELGKQAGMEEVVTWIWGNIMMDTDSRLLLEAKEKEWGINGKS